MSYFFAFATTVSYCICFKVSYTSFVVVDSGFITITIGSSLMIIMGIIAVITVIVVIKELVAVTAVVVVIGKPALQMDCNFKINYYSMKLRHANYSVVVEEILKAWINCPY